MEKSKAPYRSLLLSLGVWLLVVLWALGMGSAPGIHPDWISFIRLPRILMASGVGMGLAVAGVTLQALFSNPFCEAYTLGISSGSALSAVIGLAFGIEPIFGWIGGRISGGISTAFLGAFCTTSAVIWISRRIGHPTDPEVRHKNSSSQLLVGFMFCFLGMNAVALWISFLDLQGISSALFWLFGDLSRARLQGSLSVVGMIAGTSLMIWQCSRELDALLLGEEGALTLGVDARRVRGKLILLTSLIVGVCVSSSGMIGFLGLVVPVICRRWVGSLHGLLIPVCAIWGAVTLVIADTLARSLVSPFELPVGIITSFIGIPALLLFMSRTPWRKESLSAPSFVTGRLTQQEDS